MRAVVLLVLLCVGCKAYPDYCYLPSAGRVVYPTDPMDEDAGLELE